MRSIVGRLGRPRRWREGIAHRGVVLCQRLAPGVAVTVRYVAPTGTVGTAPTTPSAFSFDRWRADDPSVPGDVSASLDAADVIVGVTIAGDLVGRCVVSPRPAPSGDLERGDPAGASLWDLAVEPAYRCRGLGRALLWRARTDAVVDDAERVEALVAVDNAPSRRAFRAAGFEPADRVIAVGLGERRYRRRRSLVAGKGE